MEEKYRKLIEKARVKALKNPDARSVKKIEKRIMGLNDPELSEAFARAVKGGEAVEAQNKMSEGSLKQEGRIVDLKSEDSKAAVFGALDRKTFNYEGKQYSVESKDEIKTMMTDGETLFVDAQNTEETKMDFAFEGLTKDQLTYQAAFKKAFEDKEIDVTLINVEEKIVIPLDYNATRDFAATLEGVVDGTVTDGYVDGNKVYIVTEDNLYERTLPEGTDTSKLTDAEFRVAVADATEGEKVYNGYSKTELDALANQKDSKGRVILSEAQMTAVMNNIAMKIPNATSVQIFEDHELDPDITGNWNCAVVTLKVIGRNAEGMICGTKDFTGEKVYAQKGSQVNEGIATLMTVGKLGEMNISSVTDENGINHGYGIQVYPKVTIEKQ